MKPAFLKNISLFFPEEEIEYKIGCEEFLTWENKKVLMSSGIASPDARGTGMFLIGYVFY